MSRSLWLCRCLCVLVAFANDEDKGNMQWWRLRHKKKHTHEIEEFIWWSCAQYATPRLDWITNKTTRTSVELRVPVPTEYKEEIKVYKRLPGQHTLLCLAAAALSLSLCLSMCVWFFLSLVLFLFVPCTWSMLSNNNHNHRAQIPTRTH